MCPIDERVLPLTVQCGHLYLKQGNLHNSFSNRRLVIGKKFRFPMSRPTYEIHLACTHHSVFSIFS